MIVFDWEGDFCLIFLNGQTPSHIQGQKVPGNESGAVNSERRDVNKTLPSTAENEQPALLQFH